MPASSSRVISVSSLIGVFALTLAAQSNGSAPASTWDPPRLSDGQPNVQGMWIAVNDSVFTLTPAVEDDNLERNRTRAPRPDPSRVAEPNHVIPYQPWAKAKQLLLQAYKDNPAQDFYIDPQVRCLPSPIRGAFWQDFQLLQYPGYVVFEYEGYHAFRIIPVDGRPHANSSIKLWMGDSRGHWEGNTLVVEITNNNSKGRLSREGDFADENLQVTERYTFLDAKRLKFESVLTDPTVYTRPWKIVAEFMPKRGGPGYEQWEEACHEGERDSAVASENIK